MSAPGLSIVHTVSSLQGGGMEQFVLRLAEAQGARGHEASVLAITGGPLQEIAARKGIVLTVLRGGKAERIARCAAHFALRRPDIVHGHNPTSLQYATIAKVFGRSRLIFTDHAQTRGIVRVGTRLEWALVDGHASVSGETAKHAGDIGHRGTTEVVHNGVDFAPARRPRAEVRAELGLGDRVVAVNVASFHAVKAQDVLVRAAAELRRSGAKVTTLFLGDGAERAAVEKLAEELGLGPEEARFLGFREDVPDLLSASDLFVLPSRAEGLPISILEAMSHRLPVVCTAVGGNPELVTGGEHGYLVPVDDPAALASAMATLARDPGLRALLGEAGSRRVERDFSFARTADRYEEMYRRALGERRRSLVV